MMWFITKMGRCVQDFAIRQCTQIIEWFPYFVLLSKNHRFHPSLFWRVIMAQPGMEGTKTEWQISWRIIFRQRMHPISLILPSHPLTPFGLFSIRILVEIILCLRILAISHLILAIWTMRLFRTPVLKNNTSGDLTSYY
jgi:hypothetical protein